jgi:hypothetical protein
MDVKSFVDALLPALSTISLIEDIAYNTEGPIVNGRAHLHGGGERFVRFFFNQTTGTLAFALIAGQQRVWGIDFDNRRGWHLHPVDNPKNHITIDPQSAPAIRPYTGLISE